MTDKIIFFSTSPGVADLFPVMPAVNHRPNWTHNVKESFKQTHREAKGDRFTHLYRCPGIIDIMKMGFIVTLPWDVMIETNGDGKSFKWTLPSTDLQHVMNSQFVSAHNDQATGFLPHKPYSLKTIIKLNTPWYIVAPKNLKFLVIPVAYSEENDFEAMPGILDPGISAEINFQIRWNRLQGSKVLKAGTPMCQLIPISEKSFDYEVRDANEKDLGWIQKRNYFFNFSFTHKKNIMKSMYEKYFKNYS